MTSLAVQYGERHLDPLEQVALHPVGAGAPDFAVAAVFKAVNPGVFEEAPDDGAHPDILGNPGNARAQAADAANQQAHRHPGL